MPWYGWLILACVVIVMLGGVVTMWLLSRSFQRMDKQIDNTFGGPVRAPRPRGWDRR